MRDRNGHSNMATRDLSKQLPLKYSPSIFTLQLRAIKGLPMSCHQIALLMWERNLLFSLETNVFTVLPNSKEDKVSERQMEDLRLDLLFVIDARFHHDGIRSHVAE